MKSSKTTNALLLLVVLTAFYAIHLLNGILFQAKLTEDNSQDRHIQEMQALFNASK